MTLGERLELARKQLNLKKVDIAEAGKISAPAITKILNGQSTPTRQTISLISQNLGLNENWLITGEGEMFSLASKEEEIANISALLFQDNDNFKLRLTKLVMQLTPEQIELCKLKIKELIEE